MRFTLEMRRATLDFERPRIVGVINVTPDSFSDGGLLRDLEAAVAFGLRLAADGADVIRVIEPARPSA